jgi:hypothetical protein
MDNKTQFSREWLREVITYFRDWDVWYSPDTSDRHLDFVANIANTDGIFPDGLIDATKLVSGRLPEQYLLDLSYVANHWVWCRDCEADFEKGDYWYVRTLLEWSRISRGCFEPQCLSEIWLPLTAPDPEYPEAKEQNIEVSYLLGETRWTFELAELSGWMDTTLVRKVNESISRSGRQFALVEPNGDCDQCAYVCCLTMEQVAKLKNERGWKFYEHAFCPS